MLSPNGDEESDRGEMTCHVAEGIPSENKVLTLRGVKDGSFQTSPVSLGTGHRTDAVMFVE